MEESVWINSAFFFFFLAWVCLQLGSQKHPCSGKWNLISACCLTPLFIYLCALHFINLTHNLSTPLLGPLTYQCIHHFYQIQRFIFPVLEYSFPCRGRKVRPNVVVILVDGQMQYPAQLSVFVMAIVWVHFHTRGRNTVFTFIKFQIDKFK